MASYKAIVDFTDLQTGIEYKAGDTFPKSGSVDENRAKQLMTPTSQRGAFIAEAAGIVEKKSRKTASKKEE